MPSDIPKDWTPMRSPQSCNDCSQNPFNIRGTYEKRCAQRIVMKLWKGERNTCPYHQLEEGIDIEYAEDGRIAN